MRIAANTKHQHNKELFWTRVGEGVARAVSAMETFWRMQAKSSSGPAAKVNWATTLWLVRVSRLHLVSESFFANGDALFVLRNGLFGRCSYKRRTKLIIARR